MSDETILHPPFPWLVPLRGVLGDMAPAPDGRWEWVSRWPLLVHADIPAACELCGKPCVMAIRAEVFPIFRADGSLASAVSRGAKLRCPSCEKEFPLRPEHFMPLLMTPH